MFQSVSNSSYLHLEAVGKASTPGAPYCVVNEIVAAEVGRRVRLPVPPCCVVEDGQGKAFFASLSFNLTGNTLPPIIPNDFAATFGEKLQTSWFSMRSSATLIGTQAI